MSGFQKLILTRLTVMLTGHFWILFKRKKVLEPNGDHGLEVAYH